jgi:hypothetical protein
MYSLYLLSSVVKWWPFVSCAVLTFCYLLWNGGIQNLSAAGLLPLPISVGTSLLAGAIDLFLSGDLMGATIYQAIDVLLRGTLAAVIYSFLGAFVGAGLWQGLHAVLNRSPG